jgi:fibronectin-binding autotransporter adhesin
MLKALQRVGNDAGAVMWLALAASLLISRPVQAQGETNFWNTGDGDWNVDSNWSLGVVPGVGTNVFLLNPATITYNTPMLASSIASLLVSNTSGLVFLEVFTNGFNVTGAIDVKGTGTLEVQAGGAVTSATLNVRVGSFYNVNGGTSSNGTISIGLGNAQGAGGRVNVGNGGVLVANTATLGGSQDGGSFTMSSGKVSIGALRVFRNTGTLFTGGVRVTGGELTTGRITIGSGNSTTTFAVGGGTVTNTGAFILGDGTATRACSFYQTNGITCSLNSNVVVGALATTPVRLLIAGGTFTAPGVELLNNIPTNAIAATFAVTNQGIAYIGTNGIVRIVPANASTYTILLGDSARLGANGDWSSTANITLTAGTPTLLAAGEDNVAHNITLTGNLTGAGGLIKDGGGILTLSGTNTYAGTTTIAAGILVAGSAENAGVSGPFGNQAANAAGTILFSGGMLRYSANNNNDYSGRFSTGGSQPFSIDVAGRSVSFGTALQGAGTSLTLTNSSGSPGSLTLAATGNDYDGSTTVNGGTLKVNGSITGTGAVTVNSGATLGGSGTIAGAVTIQSGGNLAPGNSVGTLNVGSLTMSSGTTNTFEFNSAPANDQVVVASTDGLVINGGVFTLLSSVDSSPWTVPGTYNLIQYSGTIGGSGLDSSWTTSSETNPHIANPQAGFQYAFGTSGGWVTLTISGAVSFNFGTWGVNSDGNWSEAGNWIANTGTMPPRNAGDIASFGTGTVLRTVTLDTNETVGTINFNNANSFVIADAGKTLTLDNSGSAANVVVANGTANDIRTALAMAGTQTVVDVASGKLLSVSGPISSTSTDFVLTVSGAGTLALTGTNTYGPAAAGTVGTTLGGATLQLGNALALGAGDLGLTASATIRAGVNLTVSNNIAMPATATTVTIDSSSNNLTVAGVISGSGGALTKVGSGVLTLGAVNTYFKNTTVAAGILKPGVDGAIPSGGSTTGWLVLDGGDTVAGTLDLSGRNVTVNALSGTNNSVLGQILNDSGTGTNSLTVNNGTGISTVFAGSIKDNTNSSLGAVAVTMAGAGTLNLSGDNSYSGGTIVSNGTLILSGNNSTSGRTTVSNGRLRLGNNNALGSGTLTMNGGNLDSTVGNMSNNNPQNWNSNFTFVGTSSLDMGNGAVTLGTTCQVTVSANTLQVGGVISGPFGLTKAGAGTLTIKGVNTYSGNTTAAGGNLLIDSGGVINGAQANVTNSGALLEVRNGALFATTGSISTPSAGLLVSGGSATFSGALSMAPNNTADSVIRVSGGTLTVASISLGRTGNTSTAQPSAGSTTQGLYINGGVVNIAGNLSLGDVSAANSVVNTRIDDGYLNVGGALIVGLNNTSRWSDLDVAGGTVNIGDTTMGLSIGSSQSGNAIFLLRGGTVTTPKISLGQIVGGTNHTTGISAISTDGGLLYIGSGGIVRVSTNIVPSIFFRFCILGATQDWSSSVSMTVSGVTIQAADQDGNARNITLSGNLSGTSLTKEGAGILTLGGSNSYNSGSTVNNGTLRIDGINSSSVGVNSGGTLGGVGTINASVSFSGGTLSPGSTLPGTLTVANNDLTLDSSSVLSYRLGALSSKTVVGNTLNFNLNHLDVIDSGNIGAGTYPLFTAASVNDNTGLGGSFSRSGNPSYFGAVPNTSWGYLVTVNPGSVVLTISNAPPMVNFSGTPTNGTAALNVSFTDLSDTSVYPILSRTWNFGDGATSTATSPSHSYTTSGVYTVSLIASNAFGVATNTKTAYITVLDAPPVASFNASPTSGTVPLNVTFTDTSTGIIHSWAWNFGDGNSTNVQNTSHVYTNVGFYTAQLIVCNNGGCSTNTTGITVTAGSTPEAAFSNYYGVATDDADSDGDGLSNTNEFLAGFNPTNSAAYLHVISITTSGNDVQITYLGSNGDTNYAGGPVSRTNVLEYATGTGSYSNNFQSAGQTNILSGGNGSGLVTNMVDSGGATNAPSRYYRVRVLTP